MKKEERPTETEYYIKKSDWLIIILNFNELSNNRFKNTIHNKNSYYYHDYK